MSIGSSFQWPQYPTAVAASRLVDRGMVVVASIGNSGTSGLYAAGAPGLGEKVIGTASFDNIAVYQDAFSVSPDGTKIGYTPATGAPAAPTSGTFPMARTGTTTTTNDACTALPAGSLTGMVTLIRRGTCSFYIKAFNAQSAGAAGVVLYNNTSGFITPTVAGSPRDHDSCGRDHPGRRGPDRRPHCSWTHLAHMGCREGQHAESHGQPDLELQFLWPVAGPGAQAGHWRSRRQHLVVLSDRARCLRQHQRHFDGLPARGGRAALLLQAKPKTKAGDVRTILQNSADPKDGGALLGPGTSTTSIARAQAWCTSTTRSLPRRRCPRARSLSAKAKRGRDSQALSITNSGASPVTYDLSSVNALSTGGVVTPTFTTVMRSVAFSASSVTVPAGGKAWSTATITPATGPKYGQYGGYIVLTPQGGGQVYRVPFAGFVGDYQGIQAVTPSGIYGFPWLAG